MHGCCRPERSNLTVNQAYKTVLVNGVLQGGAPYHSAELQQCYHETHPEPASVLTAHVYHALPKTCTHPMEWPGLNALRPPPGGARPRLCFLKICPSLRSQLPTWNFRECSGDTDFAAIGMVRCPRKAGE